MFPNTNAVAFLYEPLRPLRQSFCRNDGTEFDDTPGQLLIGVPSFD